MKLRLLLLFVVLMSLPCLSRADDIETLTLTNVQIGADVVNFSVGLDVTTGMVVSSQGNYSMPLSYSGPPTSMSFSLSSVQLPYYWWTYGLGQPFTMIWFDSLTNSFAGNYVYFDGAGLPDTELGQYSATLLTAYSPTGLNGLLQGNSVAYGGEIVVVDPKDVSIVTPEPSALWLLLVGLVTLFIFVKLHGR